MESANLNPPDPAEQRLETLLRQQSSAAPLADDGFSTRVLAALPPPRKRFSFGWPGWLVASLAAGLVLILGFGSFGVSDESMSNLSDWLNQATWSFSDFLIKPDLLLALIVTACTLALSMDGEMPPIDRLK